MDTANEMRWCRGLLAGHRKEIQPCRRRIGVYSSIHPEYVRIVPNKAVIKLLLDEFRADTIRARPELPLCNPVSVIGNFQGNVGVRLRHPAVFLFDSEGMDHAELTRLGIEVVLHAVGFHIAFGDVVARFEVHRRFPRNPVRDHAGAPQPHQFPDPGRHVGKQPIGFLIVSL